MAKRKGTRPRRRKPPARKPAPKRKAPRVKLCLICKKNPRANREPTWSYDPKQKPRPQDLCYECRGTRRVDEEHLKLDVHMRDQLAGALKVGVDVSLACAAMGITRQAVYKEMALNPEFKELLDQARAVADEAVVRTMWKTATSDTDPSKVAAGKFWVTNRLSGEWAERHHIGGSITHNIQVKVRVGADGLVDHQVQKVDTPR